MRFCQAYVFRFLLPDVWFPPLLFHSLSHVFLSSVRRLVSVCCDNSSSLDGRRSPRSAFQPVVSGFRPLRLDRGARLIASFPSQVASLWEPVTRPTLTWIPFLRVCFLAVPVPALYAGSFRLSLRLTGLDCLLEKSPVGRSKRHEVIQLSLSLPWGHDPLQVLCPRRR